MSGNASKSDLCLACGRCCKVLILYAPRPDFLHEPQAEEFFKARGVTIIEKGQRWYKVGVPSVCPHLGDDNACDIYETRPQGCREYDGRKDPIVECDWPAEV